MTSVLRAAIVRCLGGALFGSLAGGLLYILATRDLAQLVHGVIVGGVVGAQIAGAFKKLRDEWAVRAAQCRSQPGANADSLAGHFKEGIGLTVAVAYSWAVPFGVVFLCGGSLALFCAESVLSGRPLDWSGFGDSLDDAFWAIGLLATAVVLASLCAIFCKALFHVISAASRRIRQCTWWSVHQG